KPDVVCLAKGLAGGVPIGAVLARGPAASVLGPGDHGSTFGGNPLAAAAALVVLETLRGPGFLESVRDKGERAMREISSWGHPLVREVRGRGLMIGVAVSCPPDSVKRACMERGLLVLTAGQDAIRLLPPLVIPEEELTQGLAILRLSLDSAEYRP
ncbi:MAG TPA: aminotransferase class III-fold pyridoxal phosphate-dependent enzyme, partial [Magnetospirillaceae bacterium]|nr:aminotransferase class III-fold pyridoxal phosphate-dependent enzyme [Magnetospirillaceae bacterium]